MAIEAHPLSSYITSIEGSSSDPAVVAKVKLLMSPGESVLVLLDSNHAKAHVGRTHGYGGTTEEPIRGLIPASGQFPGSRELLMSADLGMLID